MQYILYAFLVVVFGGIIWQGYRALKSHRKRSAAVSLSLEKNSSEPAIQYVNQFTGDPRQTEILSLLNRFWELREAERAAELLQASAGDLSLPSIDKGMRTVVQETPDVADKVFTDEFLMDENVPAPIEYESDAALNSSSVSPTAGATSAV